MIAVVVIALWIGVALAHPFVPPDAVLLESVQTLTLRSGHMTARRHSDSVPQMVCVGGAACGKFEPSAIQCKNGGSDGQNVLWTCTAVMDDNFRLGDTNVICEGYNSSEDPHVLRGSCNVEYNLYYTLKGERHFNTQMWERINLLPAVAAVCVFVAILVFVIGFNDWLRPPPPSYNTHMRLRRT